MKFLKFKTISGKTGLRLLAAGFLAASVMSFTLPREFFDPHTGFEYDIFCVSFEAINTDELFIPAPLYIKPPVKTVFSLSFNEIILSRFTDQLKDSRAPPLTLI